MESPKRTQTILGDILEVKMNDGTKRYLQYIGFDKNTHGLNSDVVRVFKKEYKENSSLDFEEIIKDEVDFYAHVHSIANGIKEGVWTRVGNMKNDLGTHKPLFYQKTDDEYILWEMDGKDWKSSKDDVLESSSNMGGVIPPKWVEERIQTGKYQITDPKYIK